MQLVHIVERGERAQMSKRKGEFVTLDELLDDIGVDAARFFMLQRSHDTTVDLDLELARKQSSDNPVYYVQYAHARIASILRKAGEDAVAAALEAGSPASADLEPAERALIRRLLELPAEVAEAAERRAPHRLCAYAMATAADFHAFYRDCQVVGAEGEGVEAERIRLCVLTKRTIARDARAARDQRPRVDVAPLSGRTTRDRRRGAFGPRRRDLIRGRRGAAPPAAGEADADRGGGREQADDGEDPGRQVEALGVGGREDVLAVLGDQLVLDLLLGQALVDRAPGSAPAGARPGARPRRAPGSCRRPGR